MREKKIVVVLADGRKKEVEQGCSILEVAKSISSQLGKEAIAGEVNGKLVELSYLLEEQVSLKVITLSSEEGLAILRHHCTHLLAQALQNLYDSVQLGAGSVNGYSFYYDVQLNRSLTESDLKQIEKEMKRLIDENALIEQVEVPFEEAKQWLKKEGEIFKEELLNDRLGEKWVRFYKQGEFIDLCHESYPLLPSLSFIKAFQLTHVSGAYWQGNSNGEVMQRVAGVAFAHNNDLMNHVKDLKEASLRDHRKLGKQLELFMFSEECPGMPLYLPKGQILRNELEQFSREIQLEAGYKEVRTPSMMNQRLWKQSGHWEHYQENMYFSEVDQEMFALKPMNCPGHMLIFKNQLISYRDLPIRYAEFGQVHRHEFSGALNGLLRVRTFCQDDAHIFVSEDQIESEIKGVFALIEVMYRTFGFEYFIELSTRPQDFMGSEQLWRSSERGLKKVLDDLELPYQVNEGDGAFYGPKIDFHIKDALNRNHQCATIQLDFQMPEKFDLSYINEENERVRPVVIHRAIYGSIDRFLAILIEHYAGAFPVWLSPVQIEIIPISSAHFEYGLWLKQELKKVGIRVEFNQSDEKLGYKIRTAQLLKVPYVVIVGDEEIKNKSVNVRKYGEKQSKMVDFEVFSQEILRFIQERSLNVNV
ncbi:threonine--tRNA ligase [Alkalihalobacillus trypoxylicola]|uniref:Threonine--tRNA ligase n=1 Tax=Alkalihalobacillus trypoxylicola TaxID=519424 RepID=A0A161Q6K3_9BACI|nr:threonine--tRNA ligase [Alkalihalobacillus trypoxylicola]KYG31978.1 threonine--tRNA ligase [Alkalihalobacillus trypoxylicola]